jgi:hypothetical protein
MKTESNKKPSLSHVSHISTAEDLSFWAYFRRRNPYVFAHHPPGEVFRDHVWEYQGLYFCKGCVMTFLGMFLGTILYLATGWLQGLNLVQTGIIFWVMLLPAIITSVFPVSFFLKHLARILLGVVVISAVIMLLITPSWWVRFLIVFTYFLVLIPLSRRRRGQNDALLKKKVVEDKMPSYPVAIRY